MAVRLWSVEFDANDSEKLARFWGAALGWVYSEDEGYSSVTGNVASPRVRDCAQREAVCESDALRSQQ
jgi:hypothetical protein